MVVRPAHMLMVLLIQTFLPVPLLIYPTVQLIVLVPGAPGVLASVTSTALVSVNTPLSLPEMLAMAVPPVPMRTVKSKPVPVVTQTVLFQPVPLPTVRAALVLPVYVRSSLVPLFATRSDQLTVLVLSLLETTVNLLALVILSRDVLLSPETVLLKALQLPLARSSFKTLTFLDVVKLFQSLVQTTTLVPPLLATQPLESVKAAISVYPMILVPSANVMVLPAF